MLREKSGLSLQYTRRIRLLLIEIYKIYNCIGLRYLHNIIAKPDGILITSNNFRLNQAICFTTSYGLNSIRYGGAKRWNNLDKDVKGCAILDAFKHAILKWNLQHCTYSYCK